MHFDGGWFFWGMHILWWLFWVALVAVIAVMLTTGSGPRRPANETPLQILQRRYAAGEISTDEYEERKKHLAQGSQKAT